MCGIWLFLTNKKNLSQKKFDRIYKSFEKIKNRGPDYSITHPCFAGEEPANTNILMGFHRLSIMDPLHGNQPFQLKISPTHTIWAICNGEIYNYKELSRKYNIQLSTGSDCEIIPHLYKLIGIDNLCRELDGEFAFIIADIKNDDTDENANTSNIFICRDRFGIRPLFYCISSTGEFNESNINKKDEREHADINTGNGAGYINFSSTLAGITDMTTAQVFPPRTIMHINMDANKQWAVFSQRLYYTLDNYKIIPSIPNPYIKVATDADMEPIMKSIRDTLIDSVIARLEADRPLGCLLSGGLDSSLVASIAARHLATKGQQLNTFSIGLEGSTDEYYAMKVAAHIGSNHQHIKFSTADFINALDSIIKSTETYDITTIRASTGQYLISKWIAENTDIKVLLIGDGADELAAGYMYFHNAPSPVEMHNENIRLLEDIHYFDVLRADRGISAHGLEARVPFLCHRFVELYLSIDPTLRIPSAYGIEKGLLRRSFTTIDDYLPMEILYRRKEAFSDGVSSQENSWYSIVQAHAAAIYSDDEFTNEIMNIQHNKPTTKEGLYFRKMWINYFGDNNNTAKVIPYFWLPKWCGEINEPSARVLSIYSANN